MSSGRGEIPHWRYSPRPGALKWRAPADPVKLRDQRLQSGWKKMCGKTIAHLLVLFWLLEDMLFQGYQKTKGVFFMSAPSLVQNPPRAKMDTRTLVSMAMLTGIA